MHLTSDISKNDQMAVQEYRTGMTVYASYAMFLMCLIFFDWNPQSVFIDLTIEFAK